MARPARHSSWRLAERNSAIQEWNPAYWSTTNASDYSSALGYIPEAAWNESCDTSQIAGSTNCVFFPGGNFSTLAAGEAEHDLFQAQLAIRNRRARTMDFAIFPTFHWRLLPGHDDIGVLQQSGRHSL